MMPETVIYGDCRLTDRKIKQVQWRQPYIAAPYYFVFCDFKCVVGDVIV